MYYQLKTNTILLRALISEREELLKKLAHEKRKSISKAPKGLLHVKTRGSNNQYYCRNRSSDLSGNYISKKNIDFARKLAQREYEEGILAACTSELTKLKKLSTLNLPTDFTVLSTFSKQKHHTLLTPIIQSDEDFIKEWQSVTYEGKPFYPSDTSEYYTIKNERVRSKSEVLIADTLYRFNVPYRYEYPVYIQGVGTINPDFYCLNVRTREVIIFEHFGKMDDPDYAANSFVFKIQRFDAAGYVMGKNFVFTAESMYYPLSTKTIENIIKKYLL